MVRFSTGVGAVAADVDEPRPDSTSPTAASPATSSVPQLDPGRRITARGSSPLTGSTSARPQPLVPMQPVRRARREEESRPRSPQRRRFLLAAAALGAGGVTVQGLRVMADDDEAPAAGNPLRGSLPGAAPSATATVDPAAAALPVRLMVPRLQLTTDLLKLDLRDGDELPVPADVAAVGWFAGGSVPGRAGGPPAILVGRADRSPALAALARVRDLRRTDDLLVTRADGRTLVFRTSRITAFPARTFPDRLLYAPRSEAELRLVACTGTFGRTRKTFAGCSVVTAVLAEER